MVERWCFVLISFLMDLSFEINGLIYFGFFFVFKSVALVDCLTCSALFCVASQVWETGTRPPPTLPEGSHSIEIVVLGMGESKSGKV